MRLSKRALGTALPIISLLGALAIGIGAQPADAAIAIGHCDTYTQISTPYAGKRVWIPTGSISTWKRGGTIVRTEAQASTSATTTGTVHNITVTGSVGTKIGPVGVSVTTKYNGTWSRSTATSSSYSSRWSYSFNVPTDTLYRARLYKKGWLFKFKKYYVNEDCTHGVVWYYAAAPVASNSLGNYYWALEKYSNQGKFRYDGF